MTTYNVVIGGVDIATAVPVLELERGDIVIDENYDTLEDAMNRAKDIRRILLQRAKEILDENNSKQGRLF